MPFFIVGLPRSRTAWTATWLTTIPGVRCYHDGLRGVRSIEEYRAKLERPGLVGDCDSGLLLCWRQIEKLYPTSPWVVITRDPKAVTRSLARLSVPSAREVAAKGFEELRALSAAFPEERLLILASSDLDDPEAAERICAHIGAPFRVEHWRAFRPILIEAKLEELDDPLDAWLSFRKSLQAPDLPRAHSLASRRSGEGPASE